MGAAQHYASIGSQELRNTCRLFPTRNILALAPKFRPGEDNPLHFLGKTKIYKQLQSSTHKNIEGATLNDLLVNVSPKKASINTLTTNPIDIIVPIHGNAEKLSLLLPSLAAHTESNHHIILIDDASRDPNITELLDQFSITRSNVIVLRNDENRGYASTINLGMRMSDRHKILLNSDTVVPPNWVGAMIEPIERDGSIASVTPYSNSSSFTGFPTNRIEVPMDESDFESINTTLAQFRALDRDILTGVGFCMAINSRVVEEIGLLDEEAFRSGYFEDTEWCYRARQAGFRSVLANRLFVLHDHASASFGLESKLKALRRSERVMRSKHPNYFNDMDAYYFWNPNRDLLSQISLALACNLDRPIVIISSARQRRSSVFGTTNLAQAAYATGRPIFHFYGTHERCQLDAYTNRYGLFDFTGIWSDALDVLTWISPSRILVSGDCGERVQYLSVEAIRKAFAGERCAIFELPREGNVATALQHHLECGTFEPNSLIETNISTPVRIAVLGTPPHGKHPLRLKRLLSYVAASGGNTKFIVFGEVPDEWPSDNIAKTGLYRVENISYLLRHYRATVAYFPSTTDGSFHFARCEATSIGLPIVSHDTGGLDPKGLDDGNWVITQTHSSRLIYETLLDAHNRVWKSKNFSN